MKSHHLIASGLSRTTCVAGRACLAAFALVFCVRSTTALAAPMQWTVNGHWYEYVDTSVTWNDAFSSANAASFSGMPGYLATVTSGSENYFVSVEVAKGKLAFLGGSDVGAAVNDWTWRNGPEVGQPFVYANWNPGEPNNCCDGEDYLHTNYELVPGWLAGWNDVSDLFWNGYVVEYSPVPEPGTLGMALICLWCSRRRTADFRRRMSA